MKRKSRKEKLSNKITMSKLSFFLKQLLSLLQRPFREELKFFLLIYIASASVSSIGYTMLDSLISGLYIASNHFIICYLLTWILILIPNHFKIKILYKFFVIGLITISTLIDIVCIFIFQSTYTMDMIALAKGTNEHEIREFFDTFFSTTTIVVILFLITAMVIVYTLSLKIATYRINLTYKLGLLFLFVSVTSFYFVDKIWVEYPNISIVRFFYLHKFQSPPNLKDYYVHPQLVIEKQRMPQNLVLIIGESFSRYFSSLYGYEKETNPKLAKLSKDSTLLVFRNVTSKAINTIPSFQHFMTTNDYSGNYSSKNWYERLTLTEVLDCAGYYMYWISNQNKYGFYDNVATKYAEFCDSLIFSRDKFNYAQKVVGDEVLIPLIKPHLKGNKKKCFFIHLMGSHPNFSERYPQNRNIFKDSDYPNRKENQRQNIADYDNSIAYNDSVVYEMIKLFKDKESLVVYFSDHGLDMYHTRDNYAAHGNPKDKESFDYASKIPFMIYSSEKYMNRFPEMRKRMQNSLNNKFCTENLIYAVMDIIGIRFKNNEDVKKYSLFQL